MAKKRIVDLSISIEPNLPSDPPIMIPKIDYMDHAMGAEQMKEFYPGLAKGHLPDGLGWAIFQGLMQDTAIWKNWQTCQPLESLMGLQCVVFPLK